MLTDGKECEGEDVEIYKDENFAILENIQPSNEINDYYPN